MTDQGLLASLWRRRWIVVGAVVVAAVAAGVVSRALDDVYTTSSKLLIVQERSAAAFDAIQAAQVTARTYSDVLSSPNITARVARELGGGTTPGEIDGAVRIQPIPETQLLEIRAEAPTPLRAKQIADAYAGVFIDYARTTLDGTTEATVTLADAAPLASEPSRPKPTLYVLIACLLAVPAGIALALLRDRLDSRLGSAEDVEERFGLQVVGRVPRRGRSVASQTAFAEAFRMLRTALSFAGPDGPLRSVAVVSSSEAEGKTTTSYELAVAACEAGQRVLLVEADVYRPQLAELADPGAGLRGGPGLTTYLAGSAELEDVVSHVRPNLAFLPAGPQPPNLASLLEAPRGRSLRANLGAMADLVILDCAPLGPRADAAIFATRAEAVLLVLDLRVSTDHRLRNVLRRLQAVNAHVVGAVINRDGTVKATGYGYYGGNGDGRDDGALAEPVPTIGAGGR